MRAAKEQREIEPDLPAGSPVYPVEADVPEHEVQTNVLEVLRPLLVRFLAEKGVHAHVGSDQFVYWVEGDPQRTIAPDIYILPGIGQEDLAISSWKTWETGIVPAFAMEVVGHQQKKDYEEAPALYDELGVSELIIFDPLATIASRTRLRWQVYRRNDQGALVRIHASERDRVHSLYLGAWLRVIGSDARLRVRIADGARGEVLFPTAEEREHAERAAKEAERAAKEAALAEVARLRALLEEKDRA